MADGFQQDLALITKIPSIPTILNVVCGATGMGFAAVARVTEDRWIACDVVDRIDFGLKPGDELEVATTICHEIRQSGEAVVIDHVEADSEYCGHPTPAKYGFQSYISMPIVRANGSFFGTLCAIDPKPAQLRNPETIGMFRLFAELISFYIDAQERVASAETSLVDERETGELREQFIAVLGHDLRNPVAAISAGASLLLKRPLDERSRLILRQVQQSLLRMGGIITNVLDFARGRLGGGIVLDRTTAPLPAALDQVIAELRAVHPKRVIDVAWDISEPITCDQARIAQMLSNLLANALTHGPPDATVRVSGRIEQNALELAVANSGTPIPAEVRDRLFRPFVRGTARAGPEGLGLGLYIASEIAKAHGGNLSVTSTAEETRFTFLMPIG